MKLTSYADAGEFLAAAGDILRSDEARYGLVYGIARLTEENPDHYGAESPWFCTVTDSSGIAAMAWRTPPYQPGLVEVAADPGPSVPLLVEAIRSRWPVIPGVTGHSGIVGPFVDSWCRTCGVSVQQTLELRIYRLDTVHEIVPAPGRLRPATIADRDLLDNWVHHFNIDCFGETAARRPRQDVVPEIEKEYLYLWEDGGIPVSLCGKNRPTDRGMTIGPVYTPPEYRGRGYATNCVAAICRDILGSGKKLCMLYADLANPYSNAAYVKVGFYPVYDSTDCTFTAPR